MTRLVNLTPHAMHIFPEGTPERIEPGTVTPVLVIEPTTDVTIARLGQETTGREETDLGVPVYRVVFGRAHRALPEPVPGCWFLVSTLVALANPHRSDLLSPFCMVRDLDGNVIGSTGLARPVPREVTP